MRANWPFVIVLLALAALPGCGRKGPLEAPAGATAKDSNAEPPVPVNQRRELPGNINGIVDSQTGAGP